MEVFKDKRLEATLCVIQQTFVKYFNNVFTKEILENLLFKSFKKLLTFAVWEHAVPSTVLTIDAMTLIH